VDIYASTCLEDVERAIHIFLHADAQASNAGDRNGKLRCYAVHLDGFSDMFTNRSCLTSANCVKGRFAPIMTSSDPGLTPHHTGKVGEASTSHFSRVVLLATLLFSWVFDGAFILWVLCVLGNKFRL
jgi:hypothetical protein